MEWEEILDSPCDESTTYCSWEEYVRVMALEHGFLNAHTDIIYPVYGLDISADAVLQAVLTRRR